jgi:anti-sigma B factor antagonist
MTSSEPVSVQFTVRRSDDADGAVLWLSGELDLASAPQLKEAIHRVELDDQQRLLLDLSELEFMDSTGLAVVVAARDRADAGGGRLVLRRPTPQVERLLALVGLRDQLAFEK